MAVAVARLLDQVTGSGVAVRDVLLDKDFFAVAVMRLLQARRVPLVIPAVIRGRKPRPGCARLVADGPGGTSTRTRIGGSQCG